MYDTVEIPLTPGTSFERRIAEMKSTVELSARDPLKSPIPFRENLYYRQVLDLRKLLDVDAMLHLNARRTGTHKIQVVEAGRKCRGQIADILALIVNDHPDTLSVSRVDSCADVADGPHVSWVAQSVRAKSAQWQAEFGTAELRDDTGRKIPWSEMGKREVQTMYIGKRPNCYRVYDKLTERRAAWSLEKRRHERLASQIVLDKVLVGDHAREHAPQYTKDGWAKDLLCSGRYYLPFPDFATWFAAQCVGPMTNLVQMRLPSLLLEEPEQLKLIPELPKVLTRVERQMAAGRVPESLDTFYKLFSPEALDFNPFDRLEFSAFDTRQQVTDFSGFSPVEYAAGKQFQKWLEDGMSYQQLYAYWNTRKNAKRIARKFAPFIAQANPADACSLTSVELYERYRDSVSRQRAA